MIHVVPFVEKLKLKTDCWCVKMWGRINSKLYTVIVFVQAEAWGYIECARFIYYSIAWLPKWPEAIDIFTEQLKRERSVPGRVWTDPIYNTSLTKSYRTATENSTQNNSSCKSTTLRNWLRWSCTISLCTQHSHSQGGYLFYNTANPICNTPFTCLNTAMSTKLSISNALRITYRPSEISVLYIIYIKNQGYFLKLEQITLTK